MFEDYLQKVNDFWTREKPGTIAYGADPVVPAMNSIFSNGASLYGDRGLEIDSPKAKEAVAYIERLMAKGFLGAHDVEPGTSSVTGGGSPWVPGDHKRFRDGEAVFGHVGQWYAYDLPAAFNERGDTMGIVPFPRPDNMKPDDPEYRQFNDVHICYAVPRGLGLERIRLALEAFREYMVSFYGKMAGSGRALDFIRNDDLARPNAVRAFLDVTDDGYGDEVLAAWKYLGSVNPNEYFRNTGLHKVLYFDIIGDSLFRVNGASSFAVNVEAKMPVVNEIMNSIQKAVDGDSAIDNIAPRFVDIAGSRIAFPVATVPAQIDWNAFILASDNIDGEIAFSGAAVDVSAVDFSKPGNYPNAAAFSVQDKAGNEATAQRSVTVFDGENTVPPSLVIKNGYRTIALNEDTSAINWANDFVEAATDKDGLDVKHSVFADLSELNTTQPGSYNVVITVRDYAGNQTVATVAVEVVRQ